MYDVTNYLSFSIHGGESGLAGLLDGLLSAIETLITLPADQILVTIMPGLAVMENLHPLFVHLPIAFLLGFFLLDLLVIFTGNVLLRSVANALLYLGTVFAGITVATGLYAAATVVHLEDVHTIMSTHQQLGIAIFSLSFVLSIWRFTNQALLAGVPQFLFLFFSGLLSLLVLFTADLGGLMVYHYGVSVAGSNQHFDAQPHDHNHSH